jgi:hypothetical protein
VVVYENSFEGDSGEDVDGDDVDDRGMIGGGCDSGESGDMSDDGCGVGGGAAFSQAAAPAPGRSGSQRIRRKLSVNVLGTTKEFKKKRKTAADEISLFRQSNAESGNRVSQRLLKLSPVGTTSRNLLKAS